MNSEPFLKPRLTGERFANGEIPLEVLADFAVLSDMVLDVAKWRYRLSNPGRQRVPRGFAEGISLRLTGVGQGSAIPIIAMIVPGVMTAPPPPAYQYFLEAREAIVEAIGAAEQDRPAAVHLPPRLLNYFDRFGRNLLDGEAIELMKGEGTPVRLTKAVRRTLLLASSADDFTDTVVLHGRVHEFDHRTKTFQLTLPDGTVIQRIPVEKQHQEVVLDASHGYLDAVKVRVWGIGRFDRGGALKAVEEVEHMTLLDPLDVGVRADELALLEEGWLNGKGSRLSRGGLFWLADLFAKFYPPDLPLPYLFPTPDGHVLAEWPAGDWSPSLEINLVSMQASWHALNLVTDAEEEQTLELDGDEGWRLLSERIRALDGSAT